jgi:uncharacterized protein YciI
MIHMGAANITDRDVKAASAATDLRGCSTFDDYPVELPELGALNGPSAMSCPQGRKTVGMEFFCYHRDRPGSVALRGELLEAHWSYMDRYATQMIARGPTLARDGVTPTGSVHIVDLPDPAAARAFAFDEPNYQAGVYRDVLLRRWRNMLGRTMWDFPGGRGDGNRYLVLGLGTRPAARLAVPADRDELIAYGPLLSDNGSSWLGTAVLVRAQEDAARAVLAPDGYAGIEVRNWQFGGRPS